MVSYVMYGKVCAFVLYKLMIFSKVSEWVDSLTIGLMHAERTQDFSWVVVFC